MKVSREPNYHPCPVCGRQVEVLDGRWTRHTDPNGWSMREPLKQCEMAEQLFREVKAGKL